MTYPDSIKTPVQWIGPNVISVFVQALQTGVMICLHTTFWSQTGQEKVAKYIVVFTSVIGVLQTCLTTHDLWDSTVTGFGNWDAALGWPWPDKISQLLTALVALPVQIFLSRRCWMLWGNSRILLALLGALLLAYAVMTIAITAKLLTVPSNNFQQIVTPSGHALIFNSSPRFLASLIIPVVLDTVLTLLLLIRLIKLRSSTYTHRFRKILHSITMLTWETAVPPWLCAILSVGLYRDGIEPDFWYKPFRDVLGKLYIIALLVTLNSRAYLSELDNKEPTDWHLPSLSVLPVPVTTNQTSTTNGSLDIVAPHESKHTDSNVQPNEEPPASQ